MYHKIPLLLFFFLLKITDVKSAHLFTIQGSNTVGAKLAPECAKGFLQSQGINNPIIEAGKGENEFLVSGLHHEDSSLQPVSIKISAQGSSTGFKGLFNKTADLAMSSRPIKPDEIQALSGLGNMLSSEAEHIVGIDGLAILIHPDNPVESLSIEQIAKIFSGEITNWKMLGGLNQPIDTFARDDNSGTWDTFKKLILKKHYQLKPNTTRFESNDLLSDSVKNNINAIGFTGLSSVRHAKLVAISDTDTQSMLPSKFTVATEDYPLSRRLFFYMPPESQKPAVKAFIDFCLSASGQTIVDKIGFVSQNITKNNIQPKKDMPKHYQMLASNAQRLSLNFRFSQGSPKLDSKALRDIDRLTDYLNEYKEYKPYIYLVGFSDSGERFNQDLVLSRFRALAVRSALLKRGINVTDSHGLGSFMPIANNSNQLSKQRNGRVEVWLSDQPLDIY